MDTKQNNNTDDRNTGDRNTGDWNTGDWNTGNRNTGNLNTGDENTGNWNTGDWNAGDRNTGYRNNGCWNTGDFNSTNGSSGCFNTMEPTISFFNQPSDWTLSQWRESAARLILHCLCACPVEWVELQDMTEAEKKKYPECETLKGYLKTLSQEEQTAQTVENWKALSDKEKHIVMSIPNFDKEIFKQITGIDVDNEL